MINHKLLCLLEGKCWHEVIFERDNRAISIPMSYRCVKCNTKFSEKPQSPNYSFPNIYMPFLQWFWKEKRGMWGEFLEWVYIRELKPALNNTWKTSAFISWLFSLVNNEPRVMVLLSEWLALPETREKWGLEECPYRKEWPRTAKDGGSSFFCEKECKQEPPPCNGTGRIKAEWAKEA